MGGANTPLANQVPCTEPHVLTMVPIRIEGQGLWCAQGQCLNASLKIEPPCAVR